MVNEPNPVIIVSVIMITYGHEKYIREAIEGVLMQQCNFQVELIVANDCSPDRTDGVVKEIIAAHPNASWIHYKRHEKNLGANANYVWAAQYANGKYIANCEGDDYWTDPLKLQKQVDFLEAHINCVCVCHWVKAVWESTGSSVVWNVFGKDSISILDLAERNLIQIVSYLYRNPRDRFPSWISNLPVGDYPLHVFNAQFGLLKCFPEVMATYRIHDGGIYGSKPEQRQLRMMIDTLNGMIGRFDDSVNIKLIEQQVRNLEVYAQKFDLGDFNYSPKAFPYLLNENKILKNKILEIGSMKGFVNQKWKNLQRKFSRSKR